MQVHSSVKYSVITTVDKLYFKLVLVSRSTGKVCFNIYLCIYLNAIVIESREREERRKEGQRRGEERKG